MGEFIWVIGLCALLVGCEKPSEAPSPIVQTTEQVQDFYEKKVLPPVGDATEWVKGDLAKHGDWQYLVVDLAQGSTDSMTAKLNELGSERWEVVWIEKPEDRVSNPPYRVFLKRPTKSLLRSIKVPDLSKDAKD